jgi:hypothetical protein
MPVSPLVDDSPLSVKCPHCGYAEDDDYESIADEQVLGLHCAQCGGAFHFVVMACDACGTECLFTWLSQPSAEQCADLVCEACHQPYHDHHVEVATEPPGLFA